MEAKFISVVDYLNSFAGIHKELLVQMRNIIKSEVPDAEESISYGMPAYKLKGKALVYFAGYKNHIGFYATPSGHSEFEKELSIYKQGKGSVQFPIDKPLPIDLIIRIVQYRINHLLKS